MTEVRRLDWRKSSRYGAATNQNLILEEVGADELPITVLDLSAGFIPLRLGDERIVGTDVDPSRGRVDWVFWIESDVVPNGELIESVQTVAFDGNRYQVVSIQFFAGAPAHWELQAVHSHKLEPVGE